MKTLWNALCVVAIANLLAIGGFVGWLVQTDRLDMSRLREIRTAVSTTLSEERAAAEAEAKALEVAAKAAAAQARADQPPLTASEQLAARLEATALDQQRIERLRREVQDLQGRVDRERQSLDRERTEFTETRQMFETSQGRAMARTRDAQFRKAIETIESLKPKEAVALLREMIPPAPENRADPSMGFAGVDDGSVAGGGAGTVPMASANVGAALGDDVGTIDPGAAVRAGKARVVEYLDAMDGDVRNRILGELSKNDPGLATELLEMIRTFGVASARGSANANTSTPNSTGSPSVSDTPSAPVAPRTDALP